MFGPESDFWLYMTFFGLLIDCAAAFFLALDSTNKYSRRAEMVVSEWRNRLTSDTGPYYHKLKQGQTLEAGTKELKGALSAVRRERILGNIDSINDGDVAELKIDESERGDHPSKDDIEVHVRRPIVAVLNDGQKIVVDDFPRFRQRLNIQSRERKERNQDATPRIWAWTLLLGFILQLVSFGVRNFL